MSQTKHPWCWTLHINALTVQGRLLAVDARDALSRAMTTIEPDGKFIGETYDIPADVILEAPGNNQPELDIRGVQPHLGHPFHIHLQRQGLAS